MLSIKTGKISTIYLDEASRQRLQALADEMAISRSGVVRVLIAQAWKDRSAAAMPQHEAALPRAVVDPVAMLLTTTKEK
jgi:predicted transcriptional regulator